MKISPQGQIRLPKKIMQRLDIEKGDYVEVEVEEGHIILKRGMNPVGLSDVKLFTAVMRGEYCIHGFRNGQLAAHLAMPLSKDKTERRRQSSRICRLLLLLRAHRLIAKIPRSRRYRVTLRGFKLMTAAIFLREEYMPNYILA